MIIEKTIVGWEKWHEVMNQYIVDKIYYVMYGIVLYSFIALNIKIMIAVV